MTDALGPRALFGVIAPSTNTSVQPEYDAMRPHGVTNHMARIHIPDRRVASDADFDRMIEDIRAETLAAIDRVVTCAPGAVIMGMSAETFWDGAEGAAALAARIRARAGVPVTLGSEACLAALAVHGARRIAVLTPYMPVGDAQVRRFFADNGIEVVRLTGLKCDSPRTIAHVGARTLRDALVALDGPDADALVQVGTNLACARLAAMAEFWLDKPVIAINTATYWHALRSAGIGDRVAGFGSLLEDH